MRAAGQRQAHIGINVGSEHLPERECKKCRRVFMPRVGDGTYRNCVRCRVAYGYISVRKLILWASEQIGSTDAKLVYDKLENLVDWPPGARNYPEKAYESLRVLRKRKHPSRLRIIFAVLRDAVDTGEIPERRKMLRNFKDA